MSVIAVILLLFAATAGLRLLADRTGIPLPTLLVLGAAAREAIIDLRDRGEIGDAVMRRLQSEFDHEEVLLHQRYG
jgi:hypothetical protein